MKKNTQRSLLVASLASLFVAGLLVSSAGCQLVADFDRSLIEAGSDGTTPTDGGGETPDADATTKPDGDASKPDGDAATTDGDAATTDGDADPGDGDADAAD